MTENLDEPNLGMLHVKQKPRKKHSELSDEQRFRANARAYANVAQSRGKLPKQPCERCGSPEAQKHHEDYSKPLDVHWFCRQCHVLEHGGSTRQSAYGHGNCAKCENPKRPGSGYCKVHHAEYQRAWRRDRTEELKALRAIAAERIER